MISLFWFVRCACSLFACFDFGGLVFAYLLVWCDFGLYCEFGVGVVAVFW